MFANPLQHSDGIVGLQRYKTCKWKGPRADMDEADACSVVIQALWDMHERRPGGDKDNELR